MSRDVSVILVSDSFVLRTELLLRLDEQTRVETETAFQSGFSNALCLGFIVCLTCQVFERRTTKQRGKIIMYFTKKKNPGRQGEKSFFSHFFKEGFCN